jgi:hypothetical protein
MERYSATFQVALRRDKILAIGPQGEVEHSSRFARRRIRLFASGRKKRKGRFISGHKNRNTVPHSLVAALKPEDLNVPGGRTFDIPHPQRHVIEAFQFKHEGILQEETEVTERFSRPPLSQLPPVRIREFARLILRKRGPGVA